MQNPRMELTGQFVILAVTIIALAMSSAIEMDFASDLEIFAGPRRYPRIILSLILIFNLILIGSTLRRLLGNHRTISPRFDSEAVADPNKSGKWKALVVFAALALFVFLFESIGYILLIVPLLLFVAFMNGARRIVSTGLVCLLLALICLLVFRFGLNIVLPEGLLGIDTIV